MVIQGVRLEELSVVGKLHLPRSASWACPVGAGGEAGSVWGGPW